MSSESPFVSSGGELEGVEPPQGNPAATTLAAAAARFQPEIDGYQVHERIGEGGMATVWRATQLATRRTVALKLMTAGLGSEQAGARFHREVQLPSRLEHSNVARIYDSGVNRGVFFYAMELI